jgi:hypothetical protein
VRVRGDGRLMHNVRTCDTFHLRALEGGAGTVLTRFHKYATSPWEGKSKRYLLPKSTFVIWREAPAFMGLCAGGRGSRLRTARPRRRVRCVGATSFQVRLARVRAESVEAW